MWKKQQQPEQAKPVSPSTSSNVSSVATAVETPVPAAPVQAAPGAQSAVAAAPAVTLQPVYPSAAVNGAPASASHAPSVSPSAGLAGSGYLSKSLVIKGDITGRDALFIDGQVQGNISIEEGIVTIGPNGRVNADVTAREVVVHGNVTGNLTGRDRVQITHTGRATGNVVTRRISIDDGAEIHGNVEITPAEEVRAPRPKIVSTTEAQPTLVRTPEPSRIA